MRVETLAGDVIGLGITEVRPTVGIVDRSRRETDDFGTTTLVRRGFSRTMSLRFALPFDAVADVREKLADLRATKARWIADDRYRALSIIGLFKDFDIDVASPPQSYCTLTVEGLTQTDTAADPGGDPAIGGQASTFRMVHPVATTEATLAFSSVPEDDAPAWSASVTYGASARVLSAHRVYESLAAGNVGNDPAASGKWVDTGPSNRWRMFDEALGTATSGAGQIVVTLNSDAINAVALLDVIGATVRVQVPGYDRTEPVGAHGTALFLDLPATSGPGNLTVTVAGPGTVAVGTMLAGRLKALGVTEASPSTGITDYSRKETDDFGEVTIVPRAWAKRMEARTMIRADAVDTVFDRLASVRARNALWIGDPDSGALTTYGFFRDFSIEVDDGTAKVSLSIEGMSEAAKVKPLRVGLTPEQERALADVQADLGALLSDDVLTRGSDKLTLLRIYDDVAADRGAAHAQSLALNGSYGGDPTFAQRRASDDAMAALDAYLNSLSPPWSNVEADTPADGQTVRDRFKAARIAIADLDRANEDFVAFRTKAALDQIVAIGSDAVLSKGEKPETKIRWDELYNENESLYGRFLQLGQPAEVQPLIAAMLAARDALSDYLVSLAPHWADTTSDSPIEAATWLSRWQNALISKAAARAKMIEYSAKTAQWDGVGNKPYSRLFTNLLDTLPWVPGAADTIGRFNQNGANGQQYIELRPSGPSGVSEPALRMQAANGEAANGGWDYALFADRGEYDHRKTYRLMNWVWREPGATGNLYFGTQSQNIGGAYNMTGDLDTNPYFWVNTTPEPHKWYLAVGVLHGSGYTGGDSGVSGLYDPATGSRVQPGADFRSHPGSTSMIHRAYQYYSQPGSVSFFARPSSEEVTSATISVEQIFATVGMTTVEAAQLAAARNAIDAIGSDAVLSKGEKDAIVREYQAIMSESSALYDRFVALGSPSDLQSSISDFLVHRDALSFMLSNIAPPWNDVSSDSPIDTLLWKQRWNTAYDKLAVARAAITGRQGPQGTQGPQGPQGVSGLPGVPGADGVTWYPYYAYANSPDGVVEFTTGSPDGRAYVGFATGTSPTEPDSPSYYAWSQYRGPAFGMATSGCAVAGDTVVMTTSGGWGTAGAYSTTGYRGGAATSFRAKDTFDGSCNVMAGLNDDPASGNSYETIDYAWYLESNGNAFIYESGAFIDQFVAGFGLGTFQVVYNNRTIQYLYNGILKREIAVPPDKLLFFDSALAGSVGKSGLSDVTFTAAGSAGTDGKDGRNGVDGLPGVRGPDGTTWYTYYAYANSEDGSVDFTTGAPESRAFVGFATGTSPAEPGSPSYYAWAQYKGPPFGMAGDGVAIAGSQIIKTLQSDAWNAQAYSTNGFRGAAVASARAGQTNNSVMFGLNDDPTGNNSFDSLDYAFFFASDGEMQVYESGAFVQVLGAYSTDTRAQVHYDGKSVRYTVNGELRRIVATAPDRVMYFDSSLYQPGARLLDVAFAAAGTAGTDGTDGVSTLSAYLTNENFSWPTDAAGLPVEITGEAGTGQMRVFLGTQDVTSGCTFTAQVPFNLALIVDQFGSYQSTGLYADYGYAFVIASYQGQAIAKRVNATRTKRGVNGVSPPIITLTASDQSFSLDTNSIPKPKIVRMSALAQNSAARVLWALYREDGAVLVNWTDAAGLVASGGATAASGDLAVDLGSSTFHGILAGNGGESLTYAVRIDGTEVRDTVSIVRLRDGAKGADGRNGTDGAPGAPGADGRTTYVHTAYADTPNGQVNFTTGAPDGRAYQGFYTDFTAADSSDPASYLWTPYKGPPAFGLTGSGDTVVGGNALIKQGSGGWNTGGGHSTEGYRGGAQCSFVSGQGTGADIMAGLNSDPTTNSSYDTIDYAWYMAGNGEAAIYQNGAHQNTFFTGYGFGAFQVIYDNRTVRYLYNGVVYAEVAAPADQLLYFDAALAGPPGTRLNGIAFAAAGRAGNDGVPGTNGSNGQPGRDGRDGANGLNGADGRNGLDGRTSYVHYAYANSEDGYADFTTGAADGRSFVGIYVDYSEPDSQAANAYRWTRLRGLDGNNGIPGAPGADGRTPYVHTAYANSADGYADFTTDDAQALNRRYIGLRTDYEPADSQAANAYVWSISRGADGAPGAPGQPGAPGTSPFALDLGAAAVVVNATYVGVTKPGQLPRNIAVSVKQGTADALGAVAIGVSTSTGIAASYANGQLSITQIDADGYVELSATQGGANVVAPKRVAISRNLDPAPPSSATGQTITGYNGDPNSTSYLSGPSGRIATVEVPANGQMPISLYVDYSVAPDYGSAIRAYAAAAKIVYRPVGGSAWSDLQGEAVGSTATWRRSDEDFVQGEISYDTSVGMTAKTTFEFALMVRKQSGTGQAQYIQATLRVGV